MPSWMLFSETSLGKRSMSNRGRRRRSSSPGRLGGRKIDGEIMSIDAAAQFLGISSYTLYARIHIGLVPYLKWAGRMIFRRRELIESFQALPGCTVEEALKNVNKRSERS